MGKRPGRSKTVEPNKTTDHVWRTGDELLMAELSLRLILSGKALLLDSEQGEDALIFASLPGMDLTLLDPLFSLLPPTSLEVRMNSRLSGAHQVTPAVAGE
jgi:hypothetical protein